MSTAASDTPTTGAPTVRGSVLIVGPIVDAGRAVGGPCGAVVQSPPPMKAVSWLALAALLAATLVGAATFDRRSWPGVVGDEATYLMAAESLAWWPMWWVRGLESQSDHG